MDLGLAGRRAIVTGASRGIGAATARALAAEGVSVGLIGRDEALLDAVAKSCVGAPGTAVAVGDLATAGGVSRTIAACVEGLGGVDILVNNAASSRMGSIDDVTDGDWQAAFDLKVMGYLRCMKAVLPAMRAQRSGRIINVGGVAGIRAAASYTLAALNAAVVHLTRSTAEHVGRDGVRVLCVNPGPVMTERLRTITSTAAERAGLAFDQFTEQVLAKDLPLGRVGTPDEIARLIAVLSSEVADWMTGGGVSIDGGAARGIVGG
jgi:3-oxoacyl-[acyl-carrier protein] reductase